MDPNNQNPNQESTDNAASNTTPETTTPTTTEQSMPVETVSSTTPATSMVSKKLLWGVLAGLGLLLVILIILVALLLGQKDDATETSTNDTSSNSQTAKSDDNSSKKKVIRTVDTKDEKVKFVLYEPRQTGSNTTIDYALMFDCPGCQEQKYLSMGAAAGYGYTTPKDVYLLDEEAGQKYNPIVDEDGKMLMSPSCSDYVHNGGKINCFYAFTKVPSGTKVSLIIDSLKIDDITIN